jgi:serine/threonine-protein kinase HipA
MKRLYVWMRRPDGTPRVVGELGTTEPASGGRFESEFEYAADWVSDPDAFPLDPVSLPLQPIGHRFRAEQFHPPLSVFDDSLPDDWGRRLLAKSLSLEGRASSPPQMLLALQGGGPGALMFTDEPLRTSPAATPPTQSLSSLLSAATRFEAGTLPPGDAFRRLLEGSSRAGGARPKALVHDDEGEWLAKFPSRGRDGIFDVVGLEATCLEFARQAGMVVPDTHLRAVGRRRVLLVRRFDVTDRGGRSHMISMRTLCRERPGVYVTSYGDLALILRKYSASPSEDVAALFRHMAFNAAVGNVDDHLKNFWMLNSGSGYRLAPAFDLVPDVAERREHTLSFQYDYRCPTREVLLAIAKDWRVPRADACVDDVVGAVSKFRLTARKLAVRKGKGLELISADIRRRVELLAR